MRDFAFYLYRARAACDMRLLRGPTHEIPVPLVLGMRGDASELGSKDAGGGLGDMVTGALSKVVRYLTHNFTTFLKRLSLGRALPMGRSTKVRCRH